MLLPLGDRAVLIRFADTLSDAANRAAIAFAAQVDAEALTGVLEIVPNLVSVLLRYEPRLTSFDRLAGELRLLTSNPEDATAVGATHAVAITFDGEDIDDVAIQLKLAPAQFIAAHNERALRVLATGFAPGFVYCGMHPAALVVPRRTVVRRQVPVGTVLFAAGQTAITSTPIPTGWHVIGHTGFRNFDPATEPPTTVRAGDTIKFEVAP